MSILYFVIIIVTVNGVNSNISLCDPDLSADPPDREPEIPLFFPDNILEIILLCGSFSCPHPPSSARKPSDPAGADNRKDFHG